MSRCYLAKLREHREYESNINKFRVEQNLTVKELCAIAEVCMSNFVALANGTMSPINGEGVIRKPAENICEALGCTFAEAFPRYFCKLTPEKEVLYCQVVEVPEDDTDALLLKSELPFKMAKALSTLHYREQLIFNWYVVGGLTFEQIAQIIKLSTERVRKLYTRILRTLRRSNCGLREYQPYYIS